MTAVSKVFSRDVLGPISSNAFDSPAFALKILVQTAQNLPYCKKNGERVAGLCAYVTHNVLAEVIPWAEFSKAMDIIVRFNRRFFDMECVKDLDMHGSRYSRLLIIRFAPKLGERIKNAAKIQLADENLVSLLTSSFHFSDIYKTFTLRSFQEADIFLTEEINFMLLQCKTWKYSEGIEGYQRLLAERIDNIPDLLSLYDFAAKNEFSYLMAHCKSFVENHLFYIAENSRGKTYISFHVLADDHLLMQALPSYRDRRLLCEAIANYEGRLSLQDVKVSCIEFAVNKVCVEVNRSTLNATQFIEYKSKISALKRSKIDLGSKCLVINDDDSLSHTMIIALQRLFNFVGIDFIRYMDLTVSLLESLSKVSPDLKKLRIVQCPLAGIEIKEKIPALFPQLNLFALNGGKMPCALFQKYLALPLTSLMLSVCVVEWPEDLSGLAQLHTLELTYIQMTEHDFERIFKAILDLKCLIVIGMKSFHLSLLSHHVNTIERLTVSASTIEMEGALDTISRMSQLKTIYTEGNLSLVFDAKLKAFAKNQNVKVGHIGSL